MRFEDINTLKRQLKEWKEYPLAHDCLDAIETLQSFAHVMLIALAGVTAASLAMIVVIILWVLSKAIA